jgi:hypothetical protein
MTRKNVHICYVLLKAHWLSIMSQELCRTYLLCGSEALSPTPGVTPDFALQRGRLVFYSDTK